MLSGAIESLHLLESARTHQPVVHLVNPQAIKTLLGVWPESLVIDVRSETECAMGMLQGSVHLCHEVKDILSRGSKMRPLVFVCRSGKRSRFAAKVFAAYGFERVYSVEGGLLAWAEVFGEGPCAQSFDTPCAWEMLDDDDV